MRSLHPYFPQKPMLPLSNQVNYNMQSAHVAPVFNGPHFHNVDMQLSDACPRNFIIFDQTNNCSHITFHPEISSKFFYPGFSVDASMFQNEKNANEESKVASTFKEDSADIDALLSTEVEECDDDDDDDDMVSTARTAGNYECNSPDSCSNYKSPSGKNKSFFKKSSTGSGCNDKKRQRMRKMVKALRGIVPGSNRMSSVAVLDEAIRYLKSLRVEVQNLGAGSMEG